MDFDPRDYGDERDSRDRDDRDRDDDDALTIGRGAISHRVEEHHDERRDREAQGERGDHRERTEDGRRQWARNHDLPYFDEQVHFPDCRIEYRDIDGRDDHIDVEVTTAHYRVAHAAAVARSGFSCHRGGSARIGGRGGGSRGGGTENGGLAGEPWD